MKYNPQLDGLRCVAIVLVLLQHFAWQYIGNGSFGFIGVDLFFVLSGFLITSILLSKSEDTFSLAYRKFIGRRMLRIFPIYYLLVFVLLAARNETAITYKLPLLTYTYNYSDAGINELSHTWSLCVEEQFYLIWPFLVLGLRNHPAALKAVIGTIIALCAIQFSFKIIPSAEIYTYTGLFPRALSLCFGAVGALLYRENKLPVRLLESRIAEWVSFALLIVLLLLPYNYNYLTVPFLSLFLILKTVHKGFSFRPVNRLLETRLVVYLGSISYGIYLYHKIVRFYFEAYVFAPYFHKIPFASLGYLGKLQYNPWLVEVLKIPLFVVLSVTVAHLSFRYLERPILSLKDRWFGDSTKQQRGAVRETA